jgi:Lar family restriction alleviation protein
MEMLSCPFCGSTNLDLMSGDDENGNTAYWVYCNSCNMTGPEGNTVEETEKLWNARA